MAPLIWRTLTAPRAPTTASTTMSIRIIRFIMATNLPLSPASFNTDLQGRGCLQAGGAPAEHSTRFPPVLRLSRWPFPLAQENMEGPPSGALHLCGHGSGGLL